MPAVSRAPDRSETLSALLSIAPVAGFPIELERGYSALSSFCSRLCHHPVAGALQEANGHRFASFVILHADYSCFRRTSSTSRLDPHAIIELKRQGRKKDSVLGSAKFHNRGLAETGSASTRSSHLHRNSNGPGLWKESCQLLGAVWLVRYECQTAGFSHVASRPTIQDPRDLSRRSEERRVGKECRSRWSPYH